MKKTKTREEIQKLFKNVDETKETLLILHIDENDKFCAHVCGDYVEIGAGIATLVYDGLKVDADGCEEKLAKAIVDGVAHTLEIPSLSSIKLMLRLNKAMNKASDKIKDELDEKLGEGDNDDETPDDDDEDCETCENNRWCPLPNAIKYRKENHIPAPKKRKNGNKRGGHKKED